MQRNETCRTAHSGRILLALLASILTLLLFAVRADAEDARMYLSDLTPTSSAVGYGSLCTDTNLDGGTLSLMVDGKRTYFYKGLLAHATSTLVYDLGAGHPYDYFSAYLGLEASKGKNGWISFTISASADGETWDSLLQTGNFAGNTNAQKICLDISAYRYLKLYADAGSSDSYDHAVYAQAVVYADGAETDPVIETVLPAYSEILDLEAELAELDADTLLGSRRTDVLRCMLVDKCGYDKLKNWFLVGAKAQERETMLEWLWDDADALEELLAGGDPDGGNWGKALAVLSDLYAAYAEDLTDASALFAYADGRTRGDIYQTMMLSLALTHDMGVHPWLGSDHTMDPVFRYAQFKKSYLAETYHLRWDVFESLCVEEMRYVMGNRIWDDEICWLNVYARTHPRSAGQTGYPIIYSPHHHLAYGKNWNYNALGFQTEENYINIYDERYMLSENGVAFTATDSKLWMVFGGSHICWGISYTGTNFAAAFGVPSHYVLQPGHAAFLIYNLDSQGRGIWGIDNNISGWTQTRMAETVANGNRRMLLTWGNYGNGYSGDWPASYILLAQHALNHYDTYADTVVLLGAAAWESESEEKEARYRDVLTIMPYQHDAWYQLVQLTIAKHDAAETEALAKALTEALYEFPLPMHNLMTLLKNGLGTTQSEITVLARLNTLEQQALQKGTAVTADNSDVAQPDVTRTMANYLLGKQSSTLASFSFDGEHAGAIVFQEGYEGVRYVYSLDGGANWTTTSGTTSESMVCALSEEEINTLSAENDILIWLEGWSSSLEGNAPDASSAFRIDLQAAGAVTGVEANDNENSFFGTVSGLEYSLDEGATWSVLESDRKFTGSEVVYLRKKASGTVMTGSKTGPYTFTENTDSTRQYIPIAAITLDSYSSEETSRNDYAKYAIDGLKSTRWHTRWSGGDSERYLTVKTAEPVYFSGVDYTPDSAGQNGTVYSCRIEVSMDGVSWYQAGAMSGMTADGTKKSISFAPAYGRYIRFVGVSTVGGYCSAAMLEFFEDTTYRSKTVNGIEMISEPTKKTYYTGETVSLSGMTVKLKFTDGSDAGLDISQLTADQTVFQTAGTHTVTISYLNLTPITFDVTVVENTLTPTAISVQTMPEKTVYFAGESLDPQGIAVQANDATSVWYLPEETLEFSELTGEIGTQTVTVTYKGLQTTFQVTVKKAVQSISARLDAEAQSGYMLGEVFDSDTLTVTATYADGSTGVLQPEDYASPDSETFSETPGEKLLRIQLTGNSDISTTVAVQVYAYFTRDGLTYNLAEDAEGNMTCSVTNVAVDTEFLRVPAYVQIGRSRYPVTGIAANAFQSAQHLTEVALPGSITSIESSAFTGCDTIQTIYFTAHDDFDTLDVAEDAIAGETELKFYAADDARATELQEKLEELPFYTDLMQVGDVADEIVSISVTEPEKTEYEIGEAFSETGMEVLGVLSTGDSVPLSATAYRVCAPDMTTSGEKTVTVQLLDIDLDAEFTITVRSVTIRITKQPQSAVVQSGEPAEALTVAADAGEIALHYSWYRSADKVPSPETDTAVGTDTPSYQPSESGYYYVLITAGGNTVQSMTARVMIGDYVARIGKEGFETLSGAIAVASGAEVILLKDFSVAQTLSVTDTVRICGDGYTIKRAESFQGAFFQVTGSGSLTLSDVTLDGGAVWSGTEDATLLRGTQNTGISAGKPLVYLTNNATLTLENGTVLQNNCNTGTVTADTGGAVFANGSAKIILNHATIQRNYSFVFGSAIYHRDSTTLIMTDSKICSNHGSANYNATAICTDNNANATATDCEFCHNLGKAAGGVFWLSKGRLTLNGADFHDNTASFGAAVYVKNSGQIALNNCKALQEIWVPGAGHLLITGETALCEIPVRAAGYRNTMLLATAETTAQAKETAALLCAAGTDGKLYTNGKQVCLLTEGYALRTQSDAESVTAEVVGCPEEGDRIIAVVYDSSGQMIRCEIFDAKEEMTVKILCEQGYSVRFFACSGAWNPRNVISCT